MLEPGVRAAFAGNGSQGARVLQAVNRRINLEIP
jgi:hypothetical protein